MPPGLIEKNERMSAGRHRKREFRQMESHGLGVARGKNEPGTFALGGANGAEDVGRTRPLVVWRGRSRPAPCPAAGDLVFLPNASFVLEPDFYRFAGRLFCGDFVHEITEVFLKAAVACTSCA